MERTESKVIQVLPEHENNAIKEMEMFGWSLQSRQEVYLEKGTYPDTSLPIIIMDEIAKTRSYRIEAEHHVKLHFARSLALPNLDRVREIESEYFNLPFPSDPPPLPFLESTLVNLLAAGGIICMFGGFAFLLIFAIGDPVAVMLGIALAVGVFFWIRYIFNKTKKLKRREKRREKTQ
ncbi:hypothetical protein M1N57_00075 [Dehalococcoidales bacterium]|nr:hypothetical protein [Dehalococcoidales bacterium]